MNKKIYSTSLVLIALFLIALSGINLLEGLFVFYLYFGSAFGINPFLIPYIIFNLFLFAVAIGLFFKKNWARIGAMVGSVGIIYIALKTIMYYLKTFSKIDLDIDTLRAIISLLFSFLILYLFTHQKMKEYFK